MDNLPFEWRGRIPPDALSMDEFEVTGAGGGKFRPHKGETVWCRVYGATMSQNLGTIGGASEAYREAQATGDNAAIEKLGAAMSGLICAKAVHWTLTDPETGEPYPQPSAGPEAVFNALPAQLLLHLFMKLAGIEVPSDRGNGSSGSPDGSSETKGPRSRSRRK